MSMSTGSPFTSRTRTQAQPCIRIRGQLIESNRWCPNSTRYVFQKLGNTGKTFIHSCGVLTDDTCSAEKLADWTSYADQGMCVKSERLRAREDVEGGMVRCEKAAVRMHCSLNAYSRPQVVRACPSRRWSVGQDRVGTGSSAVGVVMGCERQRESEPDSD
jgi:hypothetical protein